MSELELLFLVLVCLYGWECACWLRRGSIAARTWLGRRWHIVHPGSLLANPHGGFVFAPPLPPLGSLLAGIQYPFSLAPDAVLVYVSANLNPGWRAPQSGRLIRFDQLKSIEVNAKKIFIDGKLLFKAHSSSFALLLADHLRRLQKIPAAERAKEIEKIVRESLDSKSLERRWQEFLKRTRWMRRLANALFVYLFLAVPIAIHFLGLKPAWIGLLAGLLALTSVTAILFHRAHKALYPEAADDRFTHFLITLLAPAATIRAVDVLSRTLLDGFHPLAIVRQLCSREAFEEFARKLLIELRFPALPLAPGGVPGAEATERSSRAALQKNVEAFLLRNDLDPDELLKPPAPADETCRAYCPRCGAQFTTAEGTCADCGGLPLIAFARSDEAGSREGREGGEGSRLKR